jgi:hypothetical protein
MRSRRLEYKCVGYSALQAVATACVELCDDDLMDGWKSEAINKMIQ